MPIGTVVLTALAPSGAQTVTFDYDPEETKFPWPERVAVIEGINTTTVQQWAPRAGDCSVVMRSGKQWITRATALAMYQNRALRGATFTYEDSEGNEATVMVEHFEAWQARGMPALYEWEATLRVLSLTALLGAPYTGV